jgi:curli biogenesis system outer membrane secretion channel CsgG
MKKILRMFLVVAVVFAAFSCRTTVKYFRYQPSPVNMADARNIAIFDVADKTASYDSYDRWAESFLSFLFGVTVYDEDGMEKRIGRYATDRVTNVLQDTEYFNIVPVETVKQAAQARGAGNIPSSDLGTLLGVDAIVEGTIYRLGYEQGEDKTYKETYTREREDGSTYEVTKRYFKRTFYIHMKYNVIKTGSREIKAAESINTSETITREILPGTSYPYDYRDVDGYNIFTRHVNTLVSRLRLKIAPTKIYEIRRLKKDETDNPQMEAADNYAEKGLYEESYNLFKSIWDETKMLAAGYNAALLLEAQMKFEDAKAMLQEVLSKYQDDEVMNELVKIKRIIAEQKKVEEQFN